MGYYNLISLMSPKSSLDPDAQAFITAAAITDTTQKAAIDKLVVDLKGYGIWSKMNAIYPFCGGTAAQHKFNLKDPRDLDVAFRLVFNGGWVHNSNGITGNKTNTFANTFLNYTTLNSGHQSLYSRSNFVETVPTYDMGVYNGGNTWQHLSLYNQANLLIGGFNSDSQPRWTLPNSSGLFINNRTGASAANLWRNGTKLIQSAQAVGSIPNLNTYIGSLNSVGTAIFPSSKNFAFSSIGDGLTDTEAANYYTAVQTFQTTLNRQVGVPIVADADAQAFLNAAVIEDVTQANAVNTLVTSLKGYGIWTKMKALYPFVGGTASSHKWNLKNPLDTDAAFRLVFNGGWTHSSGGALPNGTNAFADTYFIPNANTALNSFTCSTYTRTNTTGLFVDLGGNGAAGTGIIYSFSRHNDQQFSVLNSGVSYTTNAITDSLGLSSYTRSGSTVVKNYRNGILKTTGATPSTTNCEGKLYIGATNGNGTATFYSNRSLGFAHIGDSLTDTEAANYYTAVQTFQTTLSRNV